jgi:hypothetical protein
MLGFDTVKLESDVSKALPQGKTEEHGVWFKRDCDPESPFTDKLIFVDRSALS